MIKEYKATFIGLIFSVSCFLLYYTFIVPLLIMLPLSLTLEVVFKGIYPDQVYSKTGQGVVTSLTIIFVTISVTFFTKIIRQIKDTQTYKIGQVILFMTLLLFIVHPLVFYIDLSNDWSRASDGQFILSIGETFQMSSWTFIIIGIVIDSLKIYIQKHSH